MLFLANELSLSFFFFGPNYPNASMQFFGPSSRGWTLTVHVPVLSVSWIHRHEEVQSDDGRLNGTGNVHVRGFKETAAKTKQAVYPP